MYAMAAHGKLDENCPFWAPREPSAVEEEHLKKVRDMQDRIRRYMGSRNMSTINNKDMTKILVENFGADWAEALRYYQDAINSMDQGVSIS